LKDNFIDLEKRIQKTEAGLESVKLDSKNLMERMNALETSLNTDVANLANQVDQNY
jgi:hypothetical protein